VSDNCSALDLILHRGKPGQVYNIGGGNERTNIEMTRFILKELGKSEGLIQFVKDRPGHDRRYALDCRKTADLGFKARRTFEEDLQETVRWYQENPAWWRKIKSGEFKKYYEQMYAKRH
jgi:dTDP-glucose 4,6-dehydratase